MKEIPKEILAESKNMDKKKSANGIQRFLTPNKAADSSSPLVEQHMLPNLSSKTNPHEKDSSSKKSLNKNDNATVDKQKVGQKVQQVQSLSTTAQGVTSSSSAVKSAAEKSAVKAQQKLEESKAEGGAIEEQEQEAQQIIQEDEDGEAQDRRPSEPEISARMSSNKRLLKQNHKNEFMTAKLARTGGALESIPSELNEEEVVKVAIEEQEKQEAMNALDQEVQKLEETKTPKKSQGSKSSSNLLGKKRGCKQQEKEQMLKNDFDGAMADDTLKKQKGQAAQESPKKRDEKVSSPVKQIPNPTAAKVQNDGIDSPARNSPERRSDNSQGSQDVFQQHLSDIEDGYKEFLDSQEDEACVAYEAKKKARNDIVPEDEKEEEADQFEGDNVFIDNLPKKKNEIIILLKEVNRHIRMLEQQFFEEEDSDVEKEQQLILEQNNENVQPEEFNTQVEKIKAKSHIQQFWSIPLSKNVMTFNWGKLAEIQMLHGGRLFDVITCDPPWQLSTANPTRGVAIAYDTLTDQHIMEMPFHKIQKAGFLFVWVINAKYRFTIEMMNKNGYTLVDEVAWVKQTVNGKIAKGHGYYLQHAKETCLIGVKGDVRQKAFFNIKTDVIFNMRRGQSQKPEEIYDMAEALVPDGYYLEIFGRRNNLHNGWVTIGNEL